MRAAEDSRMISGYAVRFNEWSRDLGGFTEQIVSGAITQEVIDNSDIIMNYNHDDERMLARSTNGTGTLQLELRSEGLFFAFDAPATAVGDEVLFHVRSGNLTECSFAFTIESERWEKEPDGKIKHYVDGI